MENRQFHIKIDGPAAQAGRIPFSLLGQIVHGVQQTVYYLALAGIQYDYRHRIRVPRGIQKACKLYRIVEERGSYAMKAEVAPPTSWGDIADLGGMAKNNYLELLQILGENQQWDRLQNLLPDSAYRRKVLRSVAEYCPGRGANWELKIGATIGSFYSLPPGLHSSIRRYLVQPMTEYRALTGELVQLHLDENKLGIYYQPSQRVVHCTYNPELEDFVVANLRQLVQVFGQVQMDERGKPSKIVDVVEIDAIDLSPLEFSTVSAEGRSLVLSHEMEFLVDFDQESQEFLLEFSELNIFLGAETRDQLWEEFCSDFLWLWDEYGKSSDQNLTGDALMLKKRIKEMVQEEQTE